MLLNFGVGEDSWESLGLQGDQILNESSYEYSLEGLMLKLKLQYFWSPDAKNCLIWKDLDAGKDWKQEEKGTTEDEMVGQHHRLKCQEFEQAPEVGNGQGSLASWNPWGQSPTTEGLNWSDYTKWSKPEKEKHIPYINIYIYGICEDGTSEPIFCSAMETQISRMDLWKRWGKEKLGCTERVTLKYTFS